MTNNYQISASTWDAISAEVQRLTPAIQANKDLTPDDVKEVRRLVKLVNDASSAYNKALTASYKEYKAMLSKKLNEIGYGYIDEYITKKRNEQQTAISNRLNAKVERFTEIVHLAIHKTNLLKNSQFTASIPSQMMALFPKINSGAINNEISDWTPIELVVNDIISHADEKMIELFTQLPATSNTAKTFGQYFTTGDRVLLANIMDVVRTDQEWLMNRHIAQQMQTEINLLGMIEAVAHDKTDESLAQIRRLISIWDTKAYYI